MLCELCDAKNVEICWKFYCIKPKAYIITYKSALDGKPTCDGYNIHQSLHISRIDVTEVCILSESFGEIDM